MAIKIMHPHAVEEQIFAVASVRRRGWPGGSATRTEILGTPHDLSPEQAEGKRPTALSDSYALGVVAHEMLTGRKPFARDTLMATALAHLMAPPPDLPARVPADLAGIVMSCLAKEPQDRPASAAILRDAVRAAVATAGLDPHLRPFIPPESRIALP